MQSRRSITGKLFIWCTLISSGLMPLAAQNRPPQLLSFEQALPVNINGSQGGAVSLSKAREKDGVSSLKWQFDPDSTLTISGDIGFKPFNPNSETKARHSFMTWLYNESAIDSSLKFEFWTGDDKKTNFEFPLNFSGWRAVVVSFSNEMQGNPATDMDRLTITAPQDSGTVYFDQMALSVPVDPRWPTPDYQLPFINKNIASRANAHWGALLQYDNWLTNFEQQSQITPSDAELAALTTITKRIDVDLLQAAKPMRAKAIRKLLARGSKLTTNKDGSLKPVQMWRQIEVYHKAKIDKASLKLIKNTVVRFEKIGKHLLKLARAYRTSDSDKIRQLVSEQFSQLVAHVIDQGYTRGSAAGIMHHQGYSMREWNQAIFLGRKMLGQHQQAARQATAWLVGFGRIFRPEQQNLGFNVDVMNTFLRAILMSALMEPDTNKQVAYLRTIQQWMSYSMLDTKGLAGGIQPDGSFYHHSQHYVAYGNGGLRGLSPVVYYLGTTPFALDKPSYQRLRHAVLMTRLFSNGLKVPMSLAGRHPENYDQITLAPFKYLSLMGDKKVAQAYLRLQQYEQKIKVELIATKGISSAKKKAVKAEIVSKHQQSLLANLLTSKGLTAEAIPNGSWVMNYSNMAIHRQGEWLATVRGFSRYLVGNESYSNANHFGRYINYGHLEILPSAELDSGFSEAGWDWNRWSGTTTTHLPLEQLAARISQVDQYSGVEEILLSDQTFSGASQLQNNYAMFAMKLHGHAKYDDNLQARKSVFFYDNQIVALGSGINSDDKKHHTETTLFQQSLSAPNSASYYNGQKLTGLKLDDTIALEQAVYLLDTRNNAYFVAPNQNLRLLRQSQQSQENEHKKPTSGNFVTALLDHGKAPEDGRYQYSILINSSDAQAKQYHQQLQSETPPYQVLQQTNDVHIVRDTKSGVVGLSLFEAHQPGDKTLAASIIAANSSPVMVLSQQQGDRLVLGVTDPDLNFYQGLEQDQLTAKRQQKEVSIYSRTWRYNQPQPKISQLTLRGLWQLSVQKSGQATGQGFRITGHSQGQTQLEITSVAATPIQISLTALTLAGNKPLAKNKPLAENK